MRVTYPYRPYHGLGDVVPGALIPPLRNLPTPLTVQSIQSMAVDSRPLRPADYAWCPCYSRAPANQFDACLWREQSVWRKIQCMGGVTDSCRRFDAPHYLVPPWITMPPQGRRFQEVNTINLPAINTDTAVLDFRVPLGYDGVINGIVNRVIGPGFVEGSGDVEWRIRLNLHYLQDYGQIQTSLGDLTNPCSMQGGGIRVKSGQLIRYMVMITANGAAHLDPNDRILASLSGWYFPRP
jgi:hypothetical protein